MTGRRYLRGAIVPQIGASSVSRPLDTASSARVGDPAPARHRTDVHRQSRTNPKALVGRYYRSIHPPRSDETPGAPPVDCTRFTR